jgi:hypothetical protein
VSVFQVGIAVLDGDEVGDRGQLAPGDQGRDVAGVTTDQTDLNPAAAGLVESQPPEAVAQRPLQLLAQLHGRLLPADAPLGL